MDSHDLLVVPEYKVVLFFTSYKLRLTTTPITIDTM
jgi:hypothetical protein